MTPKTAPKLRKTTENHPAKGLRPFNNCLHEHVMRAEIYRGQLPRTEYFQSRDYDEGPSCLHVQEHIWPVLLPRPPRHQPHRALARRFCVDDELEGWRRCLEVRIKSFPKPQNFGLQNRAPPRQRNAAADQTFGTSPPNQIMRFFTPENRLIQGVRITLSHPQ